MTWHRKSWGEIEEVDIVEGERILYKYTFLIDFLQGCLHVLIVVAIVCFFLALVVFPVRGVPNILLLFLKGHTKPIHSVCWDPSGELLASVSEDSVRVWTLRSGSEGDCLHELSSNGNKFHSCVFHPTYSSLLVIGCYQASHVHWFLESSSSLFLWCISSPAKKEKNNARD